MAATLLEGEKLASKIKEGLKKDVAELKSKGAAPHLVALQVGEMLIIIRDRIKIDNQSFLYCLIPFH